MSLGFRGWKRWGMGQEYGVEEHRCDMCQRGARPPMMFQNGFNDHLMDEILNLSFQEASWHNTNNRIVWKNERGNVYQIEALLRDSETDELGWVRSSDDVIDLEYYAVIIDEQISDRAVRDLWEKERLHRLVEVRILSEEKWQRIIDEGIDAVCPLPDRYKPLPVALPEPEPIVLADDDDDWPELVAYDDLPEFVEADELFVIHDLALYGDEYRVGTYKRIFCQS